MADLDVATFAYPDEVCGVRRRPTSPSKRPMQARAVRQRRGVTAAWPRPASRFSLTPPRPPDIQHQDKLTTDGDRRCEQSSRPLRHGPCLGIVALRVPLRALTDFAH